MHLVSWNVAALSTTLARIDEDFKSQSQEENLKIKASNGKNRDNHEKRKAHRCHAFSYFLKRHNIDILCIQEHKIPHSQLSSRSEAFGVASDLPGYESFWSCNKKRGFNGVVTIVRNGLVQKANVTPLLDANFNTNCTGLNDQGRAVMTDHGDFVLFNVYVPASCGHSLTDKMRFLNSLRRAMKRQREDFGKHVILAGDLNLNNVASDIWWKARLVNVNKVLEEVDVALDKQIPKWKTQLKQYWNDIIEALKTKKAISSKTKNPSSGETFTKFRIQVQKDAKSIILGKYQASEEEALYYYEFNASRYYDADLDKECIAKNENFVSIHILTELMAKIANISWDESTLRLIAKESGLNPYSPTVKWIHSLIEEDSMIDTFRYYYPSLQSRFTCWCQYSNSRYRNEGARIDFILIDQKLLPLLLKGEGVDLASESDASHEKMALLSVTANNHYQPASFSGGGINLTVPQHVLNLQFNEPHTGIIYTPPSYSDHVAVSALFSEKILHDQIHILDKDTCTKKAQPHKIQSCISSFFHKGNSIETRKKQSNTSELCNKRNLSANSQNKDLSCSKKFKGENGKSTLFSYFNKK